MMRNLGYHYQKHWFLWTLMLVLCMAFIYPSLGASGGLLKPEVTVKFFAVSIIFFLSGLCLKTTDLLNAALQIHIHCFIQSFSLLFVPMFMLVFASFLELLGIDEWLVKGLMVVGCMPPPVSSAVVLTKAVNGNEAAAVFNSAFGSLLGIVATPMLLLSLLGLSTGVPLSSTVTQLSLTVILPLLLGQTTRMYVEDAMAKSRIPFNNIGSFMLLFIIYTTFCDTFSQENHGLSVTVVLTVATIVILIQLFLLTFLFYVTTRTCSRIFTTRDIATILFCGSHKSLTLGIPMLKILFSDSPYLTTISLPLLVYHPLQILIGSLLVPYISTWVQKGSRHYQYTLV